MCEFLVAVDVCTYLFYCRSFKLGDAFIGYQSETAAAVVLHASQTMPRGQDVSEIYILITSNH